MTLRTRKPTGKPSWPILLLAGAEKSGKSYSAALATASPAIARSYWVTVGEDQPDEYGLVGDFDIALHNGTYRDLLNTLGAISRDATTEQGVSLLVVDSMTRLWDMLKDTAQNTANAKRGGNADKDATITADLWNVAAGQWSHLMDAIRDFPGPVVLTARLDQVAVMDDRGQPTKERVAKVQAHKTLVYDVGGIVEMPARGELFVTGLRSVQLKLPGRTAVPEGVESVVPWLWDRMGLLAADAVTSPREHSAPEADGKPFDVDGVATGLDHYEDLDQLAALYGDMQRGRYLNHLVDGVSLGDLIRQRKEVLVRRAEETAAHAMALSGASAALDYDDEPPF